MHEPTAVPRRKLLRDGGMAAERFFALVEADCEKASDEIADKVGSALADGRGAARWLLVNAKTDPANAGSGSYAFLHLLGVLAMGWMWLRIAQVAKEKLDVGAEHPAFYEWKLATARYYASRTLPETNMLRHKVELGAERLLALPPEAFAS